MHAVPAAMHSSAHVANVIWDVCTRLFVPWPCATVALLSSPSALKWAIGFRGQYLMDDDAVDVVVGVSMRAGDDSTAAIAVVGDRHVGRLLYWLHSGLPSSVSQPDDICPILE